jgi:hypothetical protein
MAQSHRRAIQARRRTGLRQERAAISDVLGSLLMVGITVISAVGFGIVLLAFDGPPDQLHVDVELRTTPGADGLWETGDERMELVHMGGEPLDQDSTTLRYTADSVAHTYSGATLGYVGSAFEDDGNGLMTIGEAWQSPAAVADYLNVAQDEGVTAFLVSAEEQSRLIASGTVTGGGILLTAGSGSCTPDITAPTVLLSNAPDLTSGSGSSAVTVTAVASDACGPVDVATAPHLWYRITPGPLPGPSSYTDAGAMTFQSGTTWTRNIAAPVGGWSLAWGQTLQYYVTGLKDTAAVPNTLSQSGTTSDAIALVGSSTFVEYANAVAGVFVTAAPFANMGADDGAEAQFLEACTGGPPVSNIQALCGRTTGGVSVSSPDFALASDNQRSTMTGSGTSVHVTGFDVPAVPSSITAFTISYEAQRGTGGATNPTVQLEYQFNSACSAAWTTAGSTFSISSTSDTTTTRVVTTGQPYTEAEIESLCVRARVTNAATRPLLTDTLSLTATYSGATTTYDVNLELGWNGLPVGLTGLFELDYRVAAGETYTVEKYNGATWTACSGSLTSTTGTTFQCTLSLVELLSGSPLVRVLGTSDAGAPTTLRMDYARMVVFT